MNFKEIQTITPDGVKLIGRIIWTRFTGFTHFIKKYRRIDIAELIEVLSTVIQHPGFNLSKDDHNSCNCILSCPVDKEVIKEIQDSELLFSLHDSAYRIFNFLFTYCKTPKELFAYLILNYNYKNLCPNGEKLNNLEDIKLADCDDLSLGIFHDFKFVCEICKDTTINNKQFAELSDLLTSYRDNKLSDKYLVEFIDEKYFKRKFCKNITTILKHKERLTELEKSKSYGSSNDEVKRVFIKSHLENDDLKLQTLAKTYKKSVGFNYKLGSKNFLEKFNEWREENSL